MDAKYNGAAFGTALKVGVICGVCVAVVELYYLVLGLANTSISQPIYQTLWLLVAFLFAMAGIWAVKTSGSVKTLTDVALHSGISGAVVGIFYAVAVALVELAGSVFYLRYAYGLSSILGTVIGIVFSSALWLPVVVAVSIAGGIIYATMTNRI